MKIVPTLVFLAAQKAARAQCVSSSTSATRDSAGVTSIVVTSEGELSVSLIEAESFQADVTFFGRDSASSVFSESFDSDSSEWNLNIAASSPASSANSLLFFSGAAKTAVTPLFGALLAASMFKVNGQCSSETAGVALSLPAGWGITDEGAKRVVLEYAGPQAYGYALELFIPYNTLSTTSTSGSSSFVWLDEYYDILINSLIEYYQNPNLSFTITTTPDGGSTSILGGGYRVTINILGFTTSSGATASYDSIVAAGQVSLSISPEPIHATISNPPALGCNMGFVADSAGVCVDIDGCIDNTCGDGVCVDAIAPFLGFSCLCNDGWFDLDGTCTDIDSCNPTESDPPCGSDIDYGTCVDVAAPGTGYACYCESPSQTGYTFSVGTSIYGETLTATCNTGFSGTATSITCGTNGQWSASTGCIINTCGEPSATGYTFASGATSYGTVRTSSCATGYTGTAASVTCGNGGWATYSGCTIVSCPSTVPAQTGYVFGSSGASTYGSSRSGNTCATGYTGTASAVTCQASGSWASATGCTIVSCSSSPSQTSYTFGSGASTYGATRTASCSSGYSGTASAITCDASGSWSSSSGCTDTNGCASNPCISQGDSSASCRDVAAPGTGNTCTCASGWNDYNGVCYQYQSSCVAYRRLGQTTSGVYTVRPTSGSTPTQVYCDMTTDGGGWMLTNYIKQNAHWDDSTSSCDRGTVGDMTNGWCKVSALNALSSAYGNIFQDRLIYYRKIIEDGSSLGPHWMKITRSSGIAFSSLPSTSSGWAYSDSMGYTASSVGNVCTHGCSSFRGYGMFMDYSGGNVWHGTQGGNYGCRDGNNICWMRRSQSCNVGAGRCAYLTGSDEGVYYAVRETRP